MFYPSKTEFIELSKKGNLIPIRMEVLADTETPLTAYQKLTQSNPIESFILESVEGGEHLGRYSFIGVNPRATFSVQKDRLIIKDSKGTHEKASPTDPLQAIEEELKKYKPVQVTGLPRFTGGMVGYLGFEYLSCIEPVPRPAQDDLKLPLLHFMLTDTLIIFDRVRQIIQIVSNAHVTGDPAKAYEEASQKILSIKEILSRPLSSPMITMPSHVEDIQFDSNMPKSDYLKMVAAVKVYIKQGDIFQCVPSQRFSTKTSATPLQVYRALRTINPSPYMFLMQLDGFSLIGSSPETHVRCEDGNAMIWPIAGTQPRGPTHEEDVRLEKKLLADEKERAEHLMLVDLARNDLGRVCDFQSVHVPQFMFIERFSHVMHICSEVVGKLQKEKTAFDLMRATFPAGTLSGAPKIRAVQIIAELEKSQRGSYGGALGYFGYNGNMDTCITIRTVVLKDGTAYVQAGGGVVDDSNPENEYQETVNKAKGMAKALSLAKSFQA